ncbi:MAG TPA: OmpH family outer membrane protein [Bacteroidia bacterium]|nr:OmpH family outer membrane protein [Bacteroidia bacterium]
MWNKSVTVIVSLALGLCGTGMGLYSKMSGPKYGYVKIKDVFDRFDMKKEMETKYQKDNGWKQRELDSMAFVLQGEGNRLKSMGEVPDSLARDFSLRQNDFLARRKQLEDEKQSQTSEYNQQIINRMNQYINEYGQHNGYDFILGDDGNGNVMFASPARDITEPIIRYINDRYSGKQ